MKTVPTLPALLLLVIGGTSLISGLVSWSMARQSATHTAQQEQIALRERFTLLVRALEPAVASVNPTAALETLSLLQHSPDVVRAAIYTPERQLFAALGSAPAQVAEQPSDLEIKPVADGLVLSGPLRIGNRNVGLLRLELSRPDNSNNLLLLQSLLFVLSGGTLTAASALHLMHRRRQALANVQSALEALGRDDFSTRLGPLPGELTALGEATNRLATRFGERFSNTSNQQLHLQQRARRLGLMLRGIGAAVWEADPRSGRFIDVSSEAIVLLSRPARDWLSADFIDTVCHPEDRSWAHSFLSDTGHSVRSHVLDLRLLHSSGGYRWLRLIASTEQTEDGPILTGLALDVTEEKLGEERVAWLADHDSLTGLINRHRFQNVLQTDIENARVQDSHGALLYLDLDQFKYINDTYGHLTGDEYLRQVTQHLKDALLDGQTLGRLGGDEFGIIARNVDLGAAQALCRQLLSTLNHHEFFHQGQSTPFSASIGVALFPRHGVETGDLLANADAAMYEAKAQGRNTYRLFGGGDEMARMRDKIHWEDRIRSALKENRFKLVFQPIVDLRSRHIHHYETLLRMVDENGQLIGPGAFMAVAERFGLIRDLDRWVVEHAIATQGRSRQEGRPVSLTINLSGGHLGSPELLALIHEACSRYQADPACIVFEVTETAAVENFSVARQFITTLRNAGYRFALDDFGSGFSSFHYLKNLVVDYVKIDGSFIRHLTSDRSDRIFVKAISEMAHGLGIGTIAEFVENRETVGLLLELDVGFGQGIYFSEPREKFFSGDMPQIAGTQAGAGKLSSTHSPLPET
ncbi:bifunctional diguanylate cyclase/phosphodiesterase [Plasticicumulans acidivorans]|uniref:Diguanylate cyclase (GGDEF)-like protein n=1 Tax=Plasticicumulans acidivorans TaxID=886464 RepID=A0A317MW50_9GAMM|nr:EAL domain-containing protein [Plasticicumulans acidivorans]PWV62303.1 diguanylate cyclase (GGDEF)-like protein [Plasticicumulans acidivorans]